MKLTRWPLPSCTEQTLVFASSLFHGFQQLFERSSSFDVLVLLRLVFAAGAAAGVEVCAAGKAQAFAAGAADCIQCDLQVNDVPDVLGYIDCLVSSWEVQAIIPVDIFVVIFTIHGASKRSTFSDVLFKNRAKVNYVWFLYWVLCQQQGKVRKYTFRSWLSTPGELEESISVTVACVRVLLNKSVLQTQVR